MKSIGTGIVIELALWVLKKLFKSLLFWAIVIMLTLAAFFGFWEPMKVYKDARAYIAEQVASKRDRREAPSDKTDPSLRKMITDKINKKREQVKLEAEDQEEVHRQEEALLNKQAKREQAQRNIQTIIYAEKTKR